ncbi:transmembrane protein 35B isoform X2 [Monodelphis domestica]|uniref:transmembrane protein 35B isoform X2 n=1 Tax=Monodelphis domestica TaxID=13616 RepID=UPI0024E2377C|nr:transmembrane protein 35B isoform X2 [Monodelphis domestica]
MIVFFALRWLLGVFFMIVGTVKLSQCSLSAEVYQQMVQHEHLTSLFPEHFLGYKLSPANLLILVGWMELTGGFLLALGNPLLQGLSNIVLIFLMMGIFYSLLISKESLIAYAPVTLCLGLLLLLNTRFCYR